MKDISANDDLDNYKTGGRYRITTVAIGTTVANVPYNETIGVLEVINGSNSIMQRYTPFSGAHMYIRRYQVSQARWSAWYSYEGTIPTE